MKNILITASLLAMSLAAHSKVLLQPGLDTLDETYTQFGISTQVVGRQFEFYQETFMWGIGGALDGSYALGDRFVVMGDALFLSAANEDYGNQFGAIGVRGAYRLNNRLNVYKTREWSLRAGVQHVWHQWDIKKWDADISFPSNGTVLSVGTNVRELYSHRTYTDSWFDLNLAGLNDHLTHLDIGWSWNRRVGGNFVGVETGLKVGHIRGLYVGLRYALMP